jgi:hypothetical protein
MKTVFTIGKDLSNDLILHDKLAEPFHAQLELSDDGSLSVKDLASRFGTLVNGIKIQEYTLRVGDDLQIGFEHIQWQEWLNEKQAEFSDKKQLTASEQELISKPIAKPTIIVHEGKTQNPKNTLIEGSNEDDQAVTTEEGFNNGVLPVMEVHVESSNPTFAIQESTSLPHASEQAQGLEKRETASTEFPENITPQATKTLVKPGFALGGKYEVFYAIFAVLAGLLGGYILYCFA